MQGRFKGVKAQEIKEKRVYEAAGQLSKTTIHKGINDPYDERRC
jgi:hypothetical protein